MGRGEILFPERSESANGVEGPRIMTATQTTADTLDVLVAFTAQGVRPLALRLGGRRYEPLRVHATHKVREGRILWRVFSVSDAPLARPPEEGNHFTIAFNPLDLLWRVWERE